MKIDRVERYRQIKAAMVQRGITQTQIAKELGVTVQCVHLIVSGRATSRRVVEALIRAGVPKRFFPMANKKRQVSTAGKEA